MSQTHSTLPFQARIRKSAFFDASFRYGCKAFSVYNRTYTAASFSDPVTEYHDLLNGVVLWPVAGERQVEIAGPDASRFVELLTPRDLSSQQVGQCKYVLITHADGGIVNDPICLKLAQDRFWLSAADSDLGLYARGVNAMARMDVTISEPDVAVLQVQGPRSADFMRSLVGDAIMDLKYYWWQHAHINGIPVIVSRTGWSTERGFEIYLADATKGDALFDHLVAAGQAFDLKLGVVSQIRRIEGGLLSYGADIDLATNPYEIGLARLVNLDKAADFIARDALQKLSEQPPARLITGLTIPPPAVTGFIRPWPLLAEGTPVSKVTSLAFSPRLDANLGIALVPARYAEPNIELTVDSPDGPLAATTHALPFMDKRAV